MMRWIRRRRRKKQASEVETVTLRCTGCGSVTPHVRWSRIGAEGRFLWGLATVCVALPLVWWLNRRSRTQCLYCGHGEPGGRRGQRRRIDSAHARQVRQSRSRSLSRAVRSLMASLF